MSLCVQDAIFLLSKATEFFVESLSGDSFGNTSKNKKKTIQACHRFVIFQ
jgi:hypothetical protein